MNYSSPSLHAPVLTSQEHKDVLARELSSIAAVRQIWIAELSSDSAPASIDLPLTTVSLAGNFDASIHVTYRGARAGLMVPLLVDSGNSCLIVPDYADLAGLPNFKRDYSILSGTKTVQEPWGCPAKILKGPIAIPTQSGGTYEISDCVFYACTGPNLKGERTANFGTGCISPWPKSGSITLQSPLSYDANYSFAEFNYAPASQLLTADSDPKIVGGSLLTLYQARPHGYQVFDIIKQCPWMSLRPRSLVIGNVLTEWPGARPSIAMVDTGGGPVFLSDPDGYVYRSNWPEPVANPWWTSPRSTCCESTMNNIVIAIGDANSSFSYPIDTSTLPTSVQGLTLVMCEKCEYMMEQNGMNIGGISALFNYIMIDYKSAQIGLKAKSALLS